MANTAQLLYKETKSTPATRSTLKMGIYSNTLHSFNVISVSENKTNTIHRTYVWNEEESRLSFPPYINCGQCNYECNILLLQYTFWQQCCYVSGLHHSHITSIKQQEKTRFWIEIHSMHSICWKLQINDHFISLVFSLEGQAWQEPEPSHVTGMALAHCILGKFLGVVCHCFPPPLDVPTLAARCIRPQRRERS